MNYENGWRWGILLGIIFLSSHAYPQRSITDDVRSLYASGLPSTRWWWFATDIRESDIRYQLDWMKEMNFGGVEIAWVYPLYRYKQMYATQYNRHYPVDTTAAKWLSAEWTEKVAFAKAYADSLQLQCDFTFGSAWPVASPTFDHRYITQIYGNPDFRQLLTFSWSYPDTQWVINHLDSNAFHFFANHVKEALLPALKGKPSAMFTDSWEIKLNSTNKIWTKGFDTTFRATFGYDIIPFMEAGIDSFPDVRYDYMMHLDQYVTEGFYKPYVRQCKEMGSYSRVQCLAAPADVMTLYGMVDIPETEAMLNDPHFSRIVSSAACLASRPVVSSETFTCMYGFPATYLRKEQTADLKMVADALFAQGVNMHVYHGTPYNPAGSDSIEFFATTYFGPGGSLEDELADFNAYIGKVSSLLQQGKTYSDVAVYIPYEDAVMKGPYPKERQRVWVWGEYEMRYVYPPDEVLGYHPLWVNRHFLEEARMEQGKCVIGDAIFSMLYVDVDYLDIRALRRLTALAEQGLPVCLKSNPKQPGHHKSGEFDALLHELRSFSNVSDDFIRMVAHPPLIKGKEIPEYWCRVLENGARIIFFAQPGASNLTYPIYSGQSLMEKAEKRVIEIYIEGKTIRRKLKFDPYQSVMLRIMPDGKAREVDIEYRPKDPIVRPREQQKTYF